MLPQGDDGPATERSEHRELVALVPGVHQGMAQDWWLAQSRMARSAHGLSNGLERCGVLGNAVVPQIVEWIARQILNAELPGAPEEE